MSDENTQLLKYVMIGDEKVGKSALLTRFIDDNFDENYIPTIGVDFRAHSIKLNDYSLRVRLWDTSGQRRYISLIPTYFRNANCIIIVFDLTNTESFNNVKKWIEDIQINGHSQQKTFLIGNKSDLIDQRTVQYENAKELADSLGILYIETSAKDSTNVEQAFRLITETSNNNDDQHDIKIVEIPNMHSDQQLKLVLIGDSGVGKSSLLMRFANDSFSENFIPTIGIDLIIRYLEYNNQRIKLQIWDTSGQERFQSLISSYYRGVSGIIIVFSVTNTESFDNIQKWMGYIDEYADNDTKKLLVGNKSDLKTERIIEYEKAQELARSLGIPYIETSAKDSTNVQQIFQAIINQISPDQPTNNTNIQIGSQKNSKKTTSGFC